MPQRSFDEALRPDRAQFREWDNFPWGRLQNLFHTVRAKGQFLLAACDISFEYDDAAGFGIFRRLHEQAMANVQ